MLAISSDLPLRGRISFATYDAETREEIERREADNLVVNVGLNLIAQALNWTFVQNQNASWGSPFTALTNLGDLWGACGTDATPTLASATGLNAELGRAIVSAGGMNGPQVIYDFFLGISQGNGTIQEVGMFAQAGATQTTLTTSLASGSNYGSFSVGATPAAIPAGSTIIVGYGTTQTQSWITTGNTPQGSTTINVLNQNANANYAAGSAVAYLFGTMLDRTVIPAITKTSSMTGILEVTLTLISG